MITLILLLALITLALGPVRLVLFLIKGKSLPWWIAAILDTVVILFLPYFAISIDLVDGMEGFFFTTDSELLGYTIILPVVTYFIVSHRKAPFRWGSTELLLQFLLVAGIMINLNYALADDGSQDSGLWILLMILFGFTGLHFVLGILIQERQLSGDARLLSTSPTLDTLDSFEVTPDAEETVTTYRGLAAKLLGLHILVRLVIFALLAVAILLHIPVR